MKKLIFIAVILAVITGFAVYYYAKQLETKFDVPKVSVVVAAKAIPKNTLIKPEMVMIKQLPQDAVNQLSAKTIEAVSGHIAKENIELNEQILTTKLNSLDKKDTGLSYQIKEGYRALTVKTDEIIGVADYIKKGDFVDIAAILISSDKAKGVSSEIVLENIEVLEVGRNAEKLPEKSDEPIACITISVLATDVPKITYALSEGKYRLVLRSIVDKNIVSPAPYSYY